MVMNKNRNNDASSMNKFLKLIFKKYDTKKMNVL